MLESCFLELKRKSWNSEIYDEKESWIDNDKNKYCILCKISIFYNEAEYLNLKLKTMQHQIPRVLFR